MSIRLADVLAKAPFPLFAIHAQRWQGDRFVGDVSRDQSGVVGAVSVVYTTDIPPAGAGVAISSIDSREMRWHAIPGWEPLDFHLANFVARFDRKLLMKRFHAGRAFDPFKMEDFRQTELVIALAGESVGALLYHHKDKPLQLLRAAIRRGDSITDLGIAVWNDDARPLASLVEAVDPRFAQEFDALVDPTYPPPEWLAPEAGG